MKGTKQGIQLKQTQTLKLTPQLAQSIKILQCNQQDLALEVSTMLENNIMLEPLQEEWAFEQTINEDNLDTPNSEFDDIPQQLDIDAEWDDVYDDSLHDAPAKTEDTNEFQSNWVADHVSFDEKLESAIHLSDLSDHEKIIASNILANLDENYFLSLSPEQLAEQLNTSLDSILTVIAVIKSLDPPGISSQNIQECMLAQLHSLPECTDAVVDAHDILSDYFQYIGKKPALIMKRLNIEQPQYQSAMQVIASLSPYPVQAENIHSNQIKPDIFVRQRMGMFYASANRDMRFDIGINNTYADLIDQVSGDDKHFLTGQLQAAKFFLNALDQRQRTIVRVANAIVMQQQDYFIDGDKALKPLLMRDIAELLEVNESTISRAVNGKYLSFNHRLIELRYFFSQDLSDKQTSSGETEAVAGTATAIKALIRQYVDEEPSEKPLSDSKIEQMLKAQGISIARRTVTKYRESLGIPKTSERKRSI